MQCLPKQAMFALLAQLAFLAIVYHGYVGDDLFNITVCWVDRISF